MLPAFKVFNHFFHRGLSIPAKSLFQLFVSYMILASNSEGGREQHYGGGSSDRSNILVRFLSLAFGSSFAAMFSSL